MALPISPWIERKEEKKYNESFEVVLDRLKDEFKSRYRGQGGKIVEIDQARGLVKHYNEHDVLVYQRNSRLAWIIKRYVTNVFGMEDALYYYLVYNKEWKKGWATENFARIPKYEREFGTIVNYQVINKALEGMRDRNPDEYLKLNVVCNDNKPLPPRIIRTALVVAMSQDKESPTEFWYASMAVAINFINKYGSKFVSPWKVDSVGLPKDIFRSTDIFD